MNKLKRNVFGEYSLYRQQVAWSSSQLATQRHGPMRFRDENTAGGAKP